MDSRSEGYASPHGLSIQLDKISRPSVQQFQSSTLAFAGAS